MIVDLETIKNHSEQFKKVIAFCEKGKYDQAKIILDLLIIENPSVSEYHRIYGQMLADEQEFDKATDCLINALKWDPQNTAALIMMGNILVKSENKRDVALTYYNQVRAIEPQNYFALNNIAANLARMGRVEQAEELFHEVLKINPTYGNTHYGLGTIAVSRGDFYNAFLSSVQTLIHHPHRDELYKVAARQAIESAQAYEQSEQKCVSEYAQKLEDLGQKPIQFSEDLSLNTAAKIEYAEIHQRAFHLVKVNPNAICGTHLQMHELAHLELALEARQINENRVFTSNQIHAQNFAKHIQISVQKFKKEGFDDEEIGLFKLYLFGGLNSLIFNTPLDMIIEHRLYTRFVELRPLQFLSLVDIVQKGVASLTDNSALKYIPLDIAKASLVYNLAMALQLNELYGVDFVSSFKASHKEMSLAQQFLSDYHAHIAEPVAGAEYKLVQKWANTLGLSHFFEMIDENEYLNSLNDVDDILNAVQEDPLGLDSHKVHKETQSEIFSQNEQKIKEDLGLNMAVVMFMIDALETLKPLVISDVKTIAIEIATLGLQGFDPQKKNYSISSFPDKTFSGYHILAYYYVSFELALPELLPSLGLPFAGEFELAVKQFSER